MFIPTRAQDRGPVARALLDAAADLDLHPRVVRSVFGGFTVPDEVGYRLGVPRPHGQDPTDGSPDGSPAGTSQPEDAGPEGGGPEGGGEREGGGPEGGLEGVGLEDTVQAAVTPPALPDDRDPGGTPAQEPPAAAPAGHTDPGSDTEEPQTATEDSAPPASTTAAGKPRRAGRTTRSR